MNINFISSGEMLAGSLTQGDITVGNPRNLQAGGFKLGSSDKKITFGISAGNHNFNRGQAMQSLTQSTK